MTGRVIAIDKWTSVSDGLPAMDGDYLVVIKTPLVRHICVCSFTNNLHRLSKWWFPGERRPGWYIFDSEGFFERSGVTHWMEMPEMPADEE